MSQTRYLRYFRRELGLARWPQDILRHSSASYLVAHSESPGQAALRLGNSEAILRRHHLNIVARTEADLCWRIRPKVGSDAGCT